MRTLQLRSFAGCATAAAVVLALAALPGNAQWGSGSRAVLTNSDVVALALAGFGEDFIIETISNSNTQFDTSVDGLVSLAKSGLSERLIRVMRTPSGAPAPKPAAAFEPAKAAPAPAPVATTQPAMAAVPVATGKKQPRAPKVPKIPVATTAINTGTPYYEWTSFMWGLHQKKVGVGVVQSQSQSSYQFPAPKLGLVYEKARRPNAAAPPAAAPASAAPLVVQYKLAP